MIKNFFKLFFILFVYLLLINIPNYAWAKNNLYRIVEDPEGVYIVEINTTKAKDRLMPYYVDGLKTNLEVYKETNAILAVNAGFFDPKNQKTVSYVTINNNLVLSPENNENLMNNKALSPYMSKILNRSEFRILEDANGRLIYDIALHDDKPKEGYKIKHAIQAGPMLFPDLRLEEEFFILMKDGKIISESASSLHKYARTAIGIKDNNVYLFIITTKTPMTLKEVSELTRRWGMEKAMAFDGGGSTSFNSKELNIISEKDNQARKLKSFLILK